MMPEDERTVIRAVEMVRAIRDQLNEETKNLSREELKAFHARESAALRRELQQRKQTPRSGRPAA